MYKHTTELGSQECFLPQYNLCRSCFEAQDLGGQRIGAISEFETLAATEL